MLYRAIAEVSDELELPQHVLRFWEREFPQVQPLRRNRRRYYRPEDIELLHGIQALLHDRGMTIAGLHRLFRERGTPFVRAVGRGEEASDPFDIADRLALADLTQEQRHALTSALADPSACRALADRCLAQARRLGAPYA